MSRLLPVLALSSLLAACADPQPPAPAAPPPASAPPASAPPAPAAPAKPEEPPSARVSAVEPGKESIPDVRARVVFKNPTGRPCHFTGYKLTWPGATKSVKLDGFTVPPGETRERVLKVHPGDGDIAKLKPESAQITLEVDCGK